MNIQLMYIFVSISEYLCVAQTVATNRLVMKSAWLIWILGSILREKSCVTRAHCYQTQITTTQTENVNLLSTKINFKQEMLSFLSLTSLLKQESFIHLS